MSKCLYADITLDLDLRIRSGEFQEKLPTARTLTQEYNVSLQTINNAVKPFIRTGLLTSERRNGLRIHRDKLSCGMVGIVGWFAPDNSNEETNYRTLIEKITADGFSHMLLSAPPHGIAPHQAGLFAKFDAIMFTNGSFNMTVAEKLEHCRVPFVGDGMQPTYPNLSFVEYDALTALENLTGKLAAAHYRQIALCHPSPRDGFNELIRWRWRKIKKQLALPPIYGDSIRYDWHDPMNDNVIYYLKMLQKSGHWPEVIIFWNAMHAWLFQRIQREIGEIPESTLLVSCQRPNDRLTGYAKEENSLPERFLLFELPSFSDFYLKAWNILKKRIYTPEIPPVQEWMEYPLLFKGPLPPCSIKPHKPAGQIVSINHQTLLKRSK